MVYFAITAARGIISTGDEDGGLRMENGRETRIKNRRWKIEDGGWSIEDRGLKIEDGRRRGIED
jgi:hypothetical protein